MELQLIDALSAVLLLSLFANIYLVYRLKKRPRKILQETYDVTDLMADLLQGHALVRVERVCPTNVILRSPRTRR
jgi:hypothetical protein